ncbi:MAG: hypothetical protein SWZ49_12945 [Cyanobacteriota bacterium]|nr:hypothetical protein [Cyanobacteriota bacterium]
MNSWLMSALTKLIRKRYALFRNLVIVLLVLSLTACGGKAVSQDASIQLAEKPVRERNAQLSSKISEVAPPEVIQELRQNIEKYQPQVKILSPQPNEILEENKIKVSFQVRDLPIFQNSQYELGSHLEVILDNQSELEVYDLNQPLELSDLSPGTHTLRVFASRPWDESFKNEGAYAQTTFHVFTKSDDNNPDSKLPILTYNSPEGSYGAEPILLDFYLTNAPLHILAKDNPDNPIADWRIRCTVNGESFIIDRWQSIYLKGFNQGKNWVKLEFLDNQGNPVKNVYNSTVKVINYKPNGKDTLAKIVRGELSAEELRGIVDADYAVEIPTEENPETQLEEKSDKGGFFDRFKRDKEEKKPVIQPETELEETIPEVIETPQTETELEETIPEVIETPQPETELEETIPEVIETLETETNPEKPKESKPDGFFNRFKRSKEDKQIIPQPKVEATPEVIETPKSEPKLEETIPEKIENLETDTKLEETIPEKIESSQTEINQEESEPEAESIQQSAKSKLDGFLNRFKRNKEDEISIPQPEIIDNPTTEVELSPELPPTLPEIVEPLENETPVIQQDIPVPEIEKTPEPQQPTTKKLKDYFNLPRRTVPVPTTEVIETPQPEIDLEKTIPEVDELEIKTTPEQQETTVPEISGRTEIVR